MPRALLVLLLALAACDAPLVSQCAPGIDPDCETGPEPGPDVVAGVDVSALFAPPSPSEGDAARARLDATPTAATAEVVALSDASDGARRFRLTLSTDAGVVLHALARVPASDGTSTPLRTLVVLPDGTDGATEADLLTQPGFGSLRDGAVQVVVAYRGEPLRADGQTFASDLPPDPYRADVRDVRAVLGALGRIPRASASRVALVGVGRGGTVALLASGLGARAAAVVTVGAPTDLFAASFRSEARQALLGQTPPQAYPAFDALVAPVLALRDGQADLVEARLGLLERSPARLGLSFPRALAFHAAGDRVVGDDQLGSLRAVLTGAGSTTEAVDAITSADLLDDEYVQQAIGQFLSVGV